MSDDRPAFKSWLDSLRDELIGPCPPDCPDCAELCECDACSGEAEDFATAFAYALRGRVNPVLCSAQHPYGGHCTLQAGHEGIHKRGPIRKAEPEPAAECAECAGGCPDCGDDDEPIILVILRA